LARWQHLLVQSFYSIDEFSGLVVQEFTLKTYLRAAAPVEFRHSSCARGYGLRL
jgi:hypothetical protein